MASTRLRAWLAIGTTIGALAASCTTGARNSDPVAAAVGGDLGDEQKQPCNAQRVLSPTCGACIVGARAAQESILLIHE